MRFCPVCGDRPSEGTTCARHAAPLLPVGTGDDATGQLLSGAYLLTSRLGAGAFGAVYRARHVTFGTEHAVKLLREGRATPEVRERLFREARALKALSSPHIVGVQDLLEAQDGRWYLVMELVQGEPLVSRAGLDLADVLRLATDVCRGLAVAHSAGVVHRDLKPSNVMISDSRGRPTAKLVDFGIALLTEQLMPGLTRQTAEGATVGTPDYMSPEQCRGKPVEAQSDLYSLGVMLYELTTGHVPFEPEDGGANPTSVMVRHCTETPVPPSMVRGARPLVPGLERLILELLAKDAARRPATAEAVAVRLEELVAAVGPGPAWLPAPAETADSPLTLPRTLAVATTAGPAAKPHVRRWAWVGAIAALGAVAWVVTVAWPQGATTPARQSAPAAVPPAAPEPRAAPPVAANPALPVAAEARAEPVVPALAMPTPVVVPTSDRAPATVVAPPPHKVPTEPVRVAPVRPAARIVSNPAPSVAPPSGPEPAPTPVPSAPEATKVASPPPRLEEPSAPPTRPNGVGQRRDDGFGDLDKALRTTP